MSASLRKEQGFTLIEIVMVIGLLAILFAGGLSLVTSSVTADRYDASVAKIKKIRQALLGDPAQSMGGARSSFGYVGDMGGLPSTAQGLAALQAMPAGASAWTQDAAARFGHGWNGPYLTSSLTGDNPLLDAWGRAFTYVNNAGTVTITSLGADGAAGGAGLNQDIVVAITPAQWQGTVYGFLMNGTNSFTTAAQVEFRYANGSGGVTSNILSISAGTQGQFQLAGIPIGYRSVTLYQPNKAGAAKTIGPVAFTLDKANYLIPTALTNFSP